MPGEYIVGVLAEFFLRKEKGARIVHDRRVIWNILDAIDNYGGYSVKSKTGHSFFKAQMRKSEAIYGGELSVHHYFRDFFLLRQWNDTVAYSLGATFKSGGTLSELISSQLIKFPSSGELNFNVSNPDYCLKKIKAIFALKALLVDFTDGVSMTFAEWRFNIRKSSTEPLVRLNLEVRGNTNLLMDKTIH